MVYFIEIGSISGRVDWRNSGGREWYILFKVFGGGDVCGNLVGSFKKVLCKNWSIGGVLIFKIKFRFLILIIISYVKCWNGNRGLLLLIFVFFIYKIFNVFGFYNYYL